MYDDYKECGHRKVRSRNIHHEDDTKAVTCNAYISEEIRNMMQEIPMQQKSKCKDHAFCPNEKTHNEPL